MIRARAPAARPRPAGRIRDPGWEEAGGEEGPIEARRAAPCCGILCLRGATQGELGERLLVC